MMLEMMAPMQSQLNEMKLLYENTKTCSTEVGDKIDELKKVIAVQQANITGAPNPMLNSQTNPALMEHYMDPSVVGKGIDAIKEQMRGVQMEAAAIESEMEGRFTALLGRREAHLRGVPKSITEELTTQHSGGELEAAIQPGFVRTRELVLERLGGAFDYSQYSEDLRAIKVEKEQLKRQFKTQQLFAPDFENEVQTKAFYDFGVSPMPNNFERRLQKKFDATVVEHERPKHLAELRPEPLKFMIGDNFKPSMAPPPAQILQSRMSDRSHELPSQAQAKVAPIIREHSAPQVDMLTLKKQVIDEVRATLEAEMKQRSEVESRK